MTLLTSGLCLALDLICHFLPSQASIFSTFTLLMNMHIENMHKPDCWKIKDVQVFLTSLLFPLQLRAILFKFIAEISSTGNGYVLRAPQMSSSHFKCKQSIKLSNKFDFKEKTAQSV